MREERNHRGCSPRHRAHREAFGLCGNQARHLAGHGAPFPLPEPLRTGFHDYFQGGRWERGFDAEGLG